MVGFNRLFNPNLAVYLIHSCWFHIEYTQAISCNLHPVCFADSPASITIQCPIVCRQVCPHSIYMAIYCRLHLKTFHKRYKGLLLKMSIKIGLHCIHQLTSATTTDHVGVQLVNLVVCKYFQLKEKVINEVKS